MGAKINKAIIIGITGSLGTGKTTVAKIFKTLGAVVIDADKMVHKMFKKETISYQEIVKAFGKCILDRFGRIDKVKLATLAFRNKKSLKKLCNIVHPVVVDNIRESIKKISNSASAPAVVIDAPLLIEAGLHNIVDYIIVVKTSRSTQIKRAMKKTRLTVAEIINRIRSQMPLSKKIQMADYVIDNEGSKSDTEKTIKKIWRAIKKSQRG